MIILSFIFFFCLTHGDKNCPPKWFCCNVFFNSVTLNLWISKLSAFYNFNLLTMVFKLYIIFKFIFRVISVSFCSRPWQRCSPWWWRHWPSCWPCQTWCWVAWRETQSSSPRGAGCTWSGAGGNTETPGQYSATWGHPPNGNYREKNSTFSHILSLFWTD